MPKKHAILPVKDVKQQHFLMMLGHYMRKTKRIEVMDKDNKLPDWVDHAKTACFKELAPLSKHWLYHRMACVMRRVYMRHPIGVGQLTKTFGGLNKQRGVRPNKTGRGAKKNIRYCLQAAEKNGWIKKGEKGRVMTVAGLNFMEDFARRLKQSRMVKQYRRRRNRTRRLKERLQKKEKHDEMVAKGLIDPNGDHAITAGGDGGDDEDDADQGTMGGIDQEYVDVQADDQDTMDVVQEFD